MLQNLGEVESENVEKDILEELDNADDKTNEVKRNAPKFVVSIKHDSNEPIKVSTEKSKVWRYCNGTLPWQLN